MQKPTPITDFLHYPVVGGTAILAVGITLAWWGKVDVSGLFEDANLRRGELWRLVTNILPHVNLYHLVFNVYWLWTFGTLIEREFGHAATLGLVVLFAAGSGGAEYALLQGGVGLSGVGYGLFGMLWVLSRKDSRFADAVDAQTTMLFSAWFVLCIVMTYTGVWPVANIAHGVGALLGAMVGLAISGSKPLQYGMSAGAALLVVLCVCGAVFFRPYINVSRLAATDEEGLGIEALTSDRNAAAVGWLRDAVRMNPAEPRAWYNLGIAYSRTGDPAAATDAFRKAVALAPDNKSYQQALEAQKALGRAGRR